MIKFHIGTLVSPVQSKKAFDGVDKQKKKTKQKETNTNLSQ